MFCRKDLGRSWAEPILGEREPNTEKTTETRSLECLAVITVLARGRSVGAGAEGLFGSRREHRACWIQMLCCVYMFGLVSKVNEKAGKYSRGRRYLKIFCTAIKLLKSLLQKWIARKKALSTYG